MTDRQHLKMATMLWGVAAVLFACLLFIAGVVVGHNAKAQDCVEVIR